MSEGKAVIFGGSGFIGQRLASYLSKKGHAIRVADVRRSEAIGRDVEFVPCDVRDEKGVREAVKGCEVVVNMAIVQIPAINENPRLGYEVNVLGTQHICEAVSEESSVKAMIQAGTWHVVGESALSGVIDEQYGYRPDKVEERARLYALSKIVQETVVRYYGYMVGEKKFVVIRSGTVLGEGMPSATAANVFIENAIKGKPITPFRHSMYRPMLYVDVNDLCEVYYAVISKILAESTVSSVYNVVYPEPLTVMEMAELVREIVSRLTGGRLNPQIEVVDKGIPEQFSPNEKEKFRVDLSKLSSELGIKELTHPRASLEKIIKARLEHR